MHWFVSQSLFFVTVRTTDHGEVKENFTFHTIGYSGIAILFIMIIGAIMMLVVTIWALCGRFPSGIPLAMTCSQVISAACHNPNGKTARLQEVKWGAVTGSGGDMPDHLMIDSGEVKTPDTLTLYY